MAGAGSRTSKKALQDFLSEAQEIVEQLSSDLLRLDEQSRAGRRIDPEVLNDAFRAAHSLKGLSGMFGIDRMSILAHRLEDLMDALRMGKLDLEPGLMDLLFEGIETLTLAIGEVSRDEAGEGPGGSRARAEGLADRIAKTLAGNTRKGERDPLEDFEIDAGVLQVLTEYEEHRLRENARQGLDLFRIHASFDLMTFDRDLSQLTARLKELGEVISTLPSGEGGGESTIQFDILVGSDREAAEIEAVLGGLDARLETVPRKSGAPTPRPAPSPTAVGPVTVEVDEATDAERTTREEITSLKSIAQTVRVDIAKLDTLMNIVGELVLSKANLQRISEGLKERMGFTDIAVDLYKEARNLERRLEELQNGVLEVRMVPLGQIFDKLSRMVRKIARESGKQITFEVSGGDTELDKLIIEDLSDPLMHLIRNSIDHGIEVPEVRAAHGKSRTGHIRVNAYQEGNHVTIEVSDDGAGMDEGAIVDTAIARGLISPDQVRELTRRDILSLVFVPGFSTRAEVSDLSGRGVGLDVVKTNLGNLSGVIDVQSERGQGTTFYLTLPITLAIIQALVIRVSGRVYAVPLNSVLEILRVKRDEVRTIEQREVIDLRGATVPLLHLSDVFGLARESESRRYYVVVVGLAQHRIGVAVDHLLGQQDVVIKSLGGKLAGVRGIAGATDLGDQRTTLVLDVGALIEEVIEGPEMKAAVM